MTHERPKYMPDVAKVLRDNEPAAFAERERKALAKLREEGLIDRLTPEPTARVSAPSPWAKDGADGAGAAIDKAALPSAMVPVTPAEEPPVTTVAKPETAVRRWPVSWKVMAGGALLTVAALGMLVGMIAMRVKDPAGNAPAVPSPTATAMPSATATEASVPDALGSPSPAATASVTAMPSATAVPRVKVQGKPRAVSDDPYDAAVPTAPVTATPAVTPAPIVTAAPLATTPPATSAAAPFLLRKRDP